MKKRKAALNSSFSSSVISRYSRSDSLLWLSVQGLSSINATSTLYKELTRHQDMMKSVCGPLEELRRFSLPSINDEIMLASNAIKTFEQSFVTPKIGELDSLLKQFSIPEIPSAFRQIMDQQDSIRRAMESMHTPWLNTADIARSVTGFSELQNIGVMVSNFQSFDDRIADALRTDLGDWRSEITWPDEIFINPLARSDFYLDLGFNPALTDFPAEAFHESLSIARLREAPDESYADISQHSTKVFDYAINKSLCDYNPAQGRSAVIKKDKVKHRPHLKESDVPDIVVTEQEHEQRYYPKNWCTAWMGNFAELLNHITKREMQIFLEIVKKNGPLIRADIDLDPWIIGVGVAYRF